MAKHYHFMVFSPAVIFNRPDDAAAVTQAEAAFLKAMLTWVTPEGAPKTAREQHGDAFIKQLLANRDAAARQSNQPDKVRHWAGLAGDMIFAFAKQHNLPLGHDADWAVLHAANASLTRFGGDSLHEKGLLRPWLLQLIKPAGEFTNRILEHQYEPDETSPEFFVFAGMRSEEHKNFFDALKAASGNRDLPQINGVVAGKAARIEDIWRLGLDQWVEKYGGRGDRKRQGLKDAKISVTAVCLPSETAWIKEARAAGHHVVEVKSDGRGTAEDYRNIDFGMLFPDEDGNAKPLRPANPDSPFARLKGLLDDPAVKG